jgi:spectinomycin phosphotransferase
MARHHPTPGDPAPPEVGQSRLRCRSMRTEPDLDQGRILECLRDRYGLYVDGLTFVPYGLDSWSYVARSTDGGRTFVKLTRGAPSRTSTGSELPLLAALATQGVPVPRPLPDRDGGFVNRIDAYDLHVLEYLEGRNLEDETAWPDELYRRVAEIVAAVHASTAAVRSLVDRVEDHELPFLPGLVASLAAIEAGEAPSTDDTTVATMHGLVAPRAVGLRAAISRLKQLRDLARVRSSEQVLCHTDIWGSNLLLSSGGAIDLLDWNGALIGPPERDLFMFAGTSFFPPERLGWFLDQYEAAFRPVRLDAATFGFYLYRRNLEDLAEFVGSILEGQTEAMAPAAMLDIVADLVAETPLIEEQIERVAEVLARRRPRGW